jgi:hypothetical protein
MCIEVDLRATLYDSPGFNILGANLRQIESLNWTFLHIKKIFFHKVQ